MSYMYKPMSYFFLSTKNKIKSTEHLRGALTFIQKKKPCMI